MNIVMEADKESVIKALTEISNLISEYPKIASHVMDNLSNYLEPHVVKAPCDFIYTVRFEVSSKLRDLIGLVYDVDFIDITGISDTENVYQAVKMASND